MSTCPGRKRFPASERPRFCWSHWERRRARSCSSARGAGGPATRTRSGALNSVTAEQAEIVLEEFHQMSIAHDYVLKGGIDYARKF